MQKALEILAPAGNAECALAALNSGANAVYLGYGRFSARASAENFEAEALREIVRTAHVYGAKVYVAMNTLVKDSEMQDFIRSLCLVWSLGADAIILQDLFLGKAVKAAYPQIELHLSTQAGVCNESGALLAKEYGFSRVILARETPFSEIEKIAKIVETEVFVQGALCTCFSGQCYFSSFVGMQSGNRGRCKQPCRKKYAYDRGNGGTGEKNYALSLSDLSVGEEALRLAQAGVTSFKIEGRMRRKEYVAAAVRYYRGIFDGTTESEKNAALSDLKRAYNRGNYTKGLGFSQDKRLLSPYVQGHIGEKVGVIKVVGGAYFVESKFSPSVSDAFKILREKHEIGGAIFEKTDKRGFFVRSKTRLKNGDGVFVTTDNTSLSRVLSDKKSIPVTLEIEMLAGARGRVTDGEITVQTDEVLQEASGRPLQEAEISECFKKTDDLPVSVAFSKIVAGNAFLPKSQLNAFRRAFYAAWREKRANAGRTSCDAEAFYAAWREKSDAAETSVCELCAYDDSFKNGEDKKQIASIARRFYASDGEKGVSIAILKPDDYAKITGEGAKERIEELFGGFVGEKYVYYPAYCRAETQEAITNALRYGILDGVYGENYAALYFAKNAGCKFFAGSGLNLTNAFSVCELLKESCVRYYALSKELTRLEQEKIVSACTKKAAKPFVIALGGIKLMDLCYCPFGKTCAVCDKRDSYTLTDENGREFPVRRYKDGSGECRFEIYNCACLAGSSAAGAGAIVDASIAPLDKSKEDYASLLQDEEAQKRFLKKYTFGHLKNAML